MITCKAITLHIMPTATHKVQKDLGTWGQGCIILTTCYFDLQCNYSMLQHICGIYGIYLLLCHKQCFYSIYKQGGEQSKPPAASESVIFHHSHTYLHMCYRVLYTLKLEYGDEIQWLIPFHGDWHLLMNYQSALMKSYFDAGLKEL